MKSFQAVSLMLSFSNRHKYSLLRGVQLFLAPFFSVISVFFPKKDHIIFTSLLNNEFSDNSRALFEALYNEGLKEKIYFVIRDVDKRNYYNSIYPGCFIGNKKPAHIFLILSAKYWVCSSLDIPLPGLFQRFHRVVYHLGHGMLYKKVGLLEKKVPWYKVVHYYAITSNFTSTISTANFFTETVANSFGMPISRVSVLPQPKTAQVYLPQATGLAELDSKSTTNILYAPTWRPYADVELFPFEDMNYSELDQYLLSNDIHIWLRLHPRFEHKISDDIVGLSNIHIFSARIYTQINSYLEHFDALITDYSSLYFDFILLKRPVVFFDYDLELYDGLVGLIDNYKMIKCTDTTPDFISFIVQLNQIKSGSFDLSKIEKINQIVNYPIEGNRILSKVVDTYFHDLLKK